MDIETVRQMLAQDLGDEPYRRGTSKQKLPPAPGMERDAYAVPRKFPTAPQGNVVLPDLDQKQQRLPDGVEPQFKFGPTGDIEKYERWRAQQSPVTQFFLPADMPEAFAMAAAAGMGPEAAYGVRAGRKLIPAAMRVARGIASRIGLSAGAGGLGAYLEGKPIAYGAAKGGIFGGVSEGVYGMQRAAGTARLGRFLTDEVPKRLSSVVQKHAPWIPQFQNPSQYMKVFQQMRRQDVGAQNEVSQLWKQATDQIDQQLAANNAQDIVTRFSDPAYKGYVGGPGGTRFRIRAPQTFKEALDAIKKLGSTAYQDAEKLRGITPEEADAARRALIEDVENHLSHFGLDDAYREARDQYGRAQSIINLFSQDGVIKDGKIDRAKLQDAWQNLSHRGLDIDAKWKPDELDELERALFGETGNPTRTDIPGRGTRIRTALTTRHIPPVYADPPVLPKYVGERPLAPWTEPQYTHFATQRAGSGMAGNIHRQPNIPPEQAPKPSDVVSPDRDDVIRAGDDGPPPDQVAQIKKLYPGMTDDEIMRLYQRHLAQQQGR